MKKSGKYQGATKLIPHLHRREQNVTHYRKLKYLEELVVKTPISTESSHSNNKWLDEYIEFNMIKRQAYHNLNKL